MTSYEEFIRIVRKQCSLGRILDAHSQMPQPTEMSILDSALLTVANFENDYRELGNGFVIGFISSFMDGCLETLQLESPSLMLRIFVRGITMASMCYFLGLEAAGLVIGSMVIALAKWALTKVDCANITCFGTRIDIADIGAAGLFVYSTVQDPAVAAGASVAAAAGLFLGRQMAAPALNELVLAMWRGGR